MVYVVDQPYCACINTLMSDYPGTVKGLWLPQKPKVSWPLNYTELFKKIPHHGDGFLTLEDGTDRLSWNDVMQLPLLAT